jgi:putative glycosyltransferase (TIGR04372 family)
MASRAASFSAFVGEQIRKTRQRPERLVLIPLTLVFKVVPPHRIRLIADFATAPTRTWRAVRERLAASFSGAAARFLEQDQPEQAWSQFQRCLRLTRDPIKQFQAGLCLLQALGDAPSALRLFSDINATRRRQAKKLGIPEGRYRVLNHFWVGGIGHLATIDYAIKIGILEGRAREDTIIYVPRSEPVPNRFLLEQWRPHAKLVDDPSGLPFTEAAVHPLHFDYIAPPRSDGSMVYFWNLAAETYRRWHAQGRKPLLQLPEDIKSRGRAELRRNGIPDDAWFVALHVREAGSKPRQRGLMAALNANVVDFLPAITEITRRGGWIIRMGDPNMARLPPMPNVFDYCHSDARADWMDIFIASQCRVFLGTSSGPAYVPPIYGVNCVLTNWWPPAHRPWHAGDIFIPKLCRQMSNGRLLTLDEMLHGPVAWSFSSGHLASRHQLRVEDSRPDDILAAVTEMLDRLDGKAHATEETLRKHADDVFDVNNAYGMAQLSSDFLRKYQHELFARKDDPPRSPAKPKQSTSMLQLLSPAEYDRAEADASENLPNRVIECAQTEVFTLLGYPTRVHSIRALWRYVDVMQEGRLKETFDNLLGGKITDEEMHICREITKNIWTLSSREYARPMISRDCLARALVVFRHIRFLFPPGAIILEIGGGSGYLGALLALAGYRHISTDICQGFYVFQSHLMQVCTSGRLIELASDPRTLDDLKEIPAGWAVHVPWWKWIKTEPKFPIAADVVSANHCLCEMHPRALAYNLKVSAALMRAAGQQSAFIFESWGWDYHPIWTAAKAFADNGLGIGHIDPSIAVFVDADAPMVGLRLPTETPADGSPASLEAVYKPPERLPDNNPLSAKILHARAALASQARFDVDDFESMLREVSGQENSRSEDERFFAYINQPHAVAVPRDRT